MAGFDQFNKARRVDMYRAEVFKTGCAEKKEFTVKPVKILQQGAGDTDL
jgi:hypothetical protein